MKLGFFGSGYVGLVSAACFAEMGNHVLCVDIDAHKVERLRCGHTGIFEPGLTELVQRNVRAGRLEFTTSGSAAVAHARLIFIAVGTPPGAGGGADLSAVHAVARTIGAHLEAPCIIVNKSTVPVGTADSVRSIVADELARRSADIAFDVVSNPEFLKEGAAVGDFMKPDRIVIGTSCAESADTLIQLYAPFNRNHDRIVQMDVRSAELTKYAANAMLATRISFMNEMANLAEVLGADIEAVRRGIGTDPRIGYHFIYAGTGFGGSCFPKDLQALLDTSRAHHFDARIIESVARVNQRQRGILVEKILQHFRSGVAGRRFALWGLAFKPNTDDMREAPSIVIIERLLAAGATVVAYDPQAGERARQLFRRHPGLAIAERRDDTLDGADALVIATEWNEFRSPDFHSMRQVLRQPLIFDGRNLFDPAHLGREGFTYYAVGRGAAAIPDTVATWQSVPADSRTGIPA